MRPASSSNVSTHVEMNHLTSGPLNAASECLHARGDEPAAYATKGLIR